MSVKITAFAATGEGAFVVPDIFTSSLITSPSMEGTGELPAPSILMKVLILPPPMNGQGEETRAIIYARKSVLISSGVMEGAGVFKTPNSITLGDSQYIIADSMEGQGGFRGPSINIGIPVLIDSLPMTGESQVTYPELRYNILDNIEFGSEVYLLVNDGNGNAGIYRGLVRKRNPEDRLLKIKAILGDGILSERIIKEDYESQDIGLTVKDFIEKYCSPLTAENVNTETGIEAPVKASGRKALQVLESIRREHGIFYFVDFTWDFHLYSPDEITSSGFEEESNRGYKIRLGDE